MPPVIVSAAEVHVHCSSSSNRQEKNLEAIVGCAAGYGDTCNPDRIPGVSTFRAGSFCGVDILASMVPIARQPLPAFHQRPANSKRFPFLFLTIPVLPNMRRLQSSQSIESGSKANQLLSERRKHCADLVLKSTGEIGMPGVVIE